MYIFNTDPNSCPYRKTTTRESYLECNDEGGYRSMQCVGSTCWCVDSDGSIL